MSRWLGAMYRRDAYLSPACRRMIDIIGSMSKPENEKPVRAMTSRARAIRESVA